MGGRVMIDIEKAKSSISYFAEHFITPKLSQEAIEKLKWMEKEDVHPEIYRGRKYNRLVFVKNKH